MENEIMLLDDEKTMPAAPTDDKSVEGTESAEAAEGTESAETPAHKDEHAA
ncbi:MAG: hypothetical protein NVSMB66_4840 [Candidatus Doudnabacteria bacterium]